MGAGRTRRADLVHRDRLLRDDEYVGWRLPIEFRTEFRIRRSAPSSMQMILRRAAAVCSPLHPRAGPRASRAMLPLPAMRGWARSRLRVHVVKGQADCVLVHDIGGDLLANDLTKYGVAALRRRCSESEYVWRQCIGIHQRRLQDGKGLLRCGVTGKRS